MERVASSGTMLCAKDHPEKRATDIYKNRKSDNEEVAFTLLTRNRKPDDELKGPISFLPY
jgi:hypothetical protein